MMNNNKYQIDSIVQHFQLTEFQVQQKQKNRKQIEMKRRNESSNQIDEINWDEVTKIELICVINNINLCFLPDVLELNRRIT